MRILAGYPPKRSARIGGVAVRCLLWSLVDQQNASAKIVSNDRRAASCNALANDQDIRFRLWIDHWISLHKDDLTSRETHPASEGFAFVSISALLL